MTTPRMTIDIRRPVLTAALGVVFSILASTIVQAAQPVAVGARLAGDQLRTRFVLDLDSTVEMGVFALADPYRVIVDLPETFFRLPTDAGKNGKGLISAFRYGRFAPGKSRLVLDVTTAVKIDKAFVLEPVEKQPARLVVDLVATDRASFLKTQSEALQRIEAANRAASERGMPIPRNRPEPNLKPVVVIDPGHGGIDGGATGRYGTVEKTVVLNFAESLKANIEKKGMIDVFLTRRGDTFVPLEDRVQAARSKNADLFISVHADALRQRSFRGATVYTLSENATDDISRELAENVNRADVLAGLSLPQTSDEVTDILVDLTRRETKRFSVAFGRTLVDRLRPTAKLVRNPLRSAGFRVLRAPDVPSVLLELGFLSNATDEKLLSSPEWRKKSSAAVADAIALYFAQRVAQRP